MKVCHNSLGIPKYIQESIKQDISKQKGQNYPCGNQVVKNYIILSSKDRIKDFENMYPNFICYRKSKDLSNTKYIDSITEEIWSVMTANSNCRGHRCYKAIIDSHIDYHSHFNTIVAPMLALYCCQVDFF